MLKINKSVTPSPEQWELVIEGARNPMNSWAKSDSELMFDLDPFSEKGVWFNIGPNDLNLLTKLARAGKDHRKYMRMIPVLIDVTAPLYWWKEFDTYKVGTTANSTSTMHKIQSKAFSRDDFSHDHMSDFALDSLDRTIADIEDRRQKFLETKDKSYWYDMIQLLPTSYNQKRTLSLNYEVLANIYHSRRNHKLDEWHSLCDFIETLPYAHLITGEVSQS